VRRLLVAAALVCACTLRAPRNDSASCGANSQCHATPIALTSVAAEVQPGSDSSFGLHQSGNVNLGASVEQDFTLSPAFTASGQVIQLQTAGGALPVALATVIFTDHVRPIPDRVQQITTRTDANGTFSARLPVGQWDVLVQPPAPLPPYRLPLPFSTSSALPPLTLPSVSSLVTVQGSVTAPGAALAGATVAAVDATGNALSSSATVAADGGYSLVLPPGTTSYFLEVGASSLADGGTAAADGGVVGSDVATLPNYDKLPGVPDVVLSLPPVANLTGTVADSGGTPLGGVMVFARSTAAEPWTFARSTVTDSTGAFSLQVRAGNYVIEAVPAAGVSDPAISPIQTVDVPAAGTTVRLICPRSKLTHSLLILLPNGKPAGANYQITATRQTDALLVTRTATTIPTDPTGGSLITGDPGTYNVLVTAPAGTGLPRRYTQLVLDPADAPNDVGVIQLDSALTVVGTVHGIPAGGRDGPIQGATVSFFGLDPFGDSLLLGSASTDSNGHYSVVLPDVANP
jgi:hypothetical protein